MNFLKRLFAPKELQAVLGVLDELEGVFDCDAFRIVRTEVEQGFLRFSDDLVATVRGGTSPRQIVLQAAANTAGDHVESGRYHAWRGTLDPLGPGKDLLRIHDMLADELVRLGAAEPEYVAKQKAGLRENIAIQG